MNLFSANNNINGKYKPWFVQSLRDIFCLWIFFCSTGVFSSVPALASGVTQDAPAALSIQLQVAVRQHFDHHKINEFWHFIDHDQLRPAKLKADFSSPKFYRFGDYYAARYLFFDVKDMPRPVIFYMTRRRPNEFVVVQVDINDDKPLENLVRNKVALPIHFDISRRSP